MAEKKPLILSSGQAKEMGAGEEVPLANLPKGGAWPLTSAIQFPAGTNFILVDEATGTKYRFKVVNGILDQEIVV